MHFFPGIFPPGSFSGLTDRVVTRSEIIGIKIGIDISRFIDHIFSSCAISIRFMLHIVFIHRCRPIVLPIIIRTPYPQGETIVHRIGKTLIHCIGIKGCRSFLIRCLVFFRITIFPFCLFIRRISSLQSIQLPSVGLQALIGGIRTEFTPVKICIHSLRETPLTPITGITGNLHHILRIVGNNIDHPSYRIASIKRRGSTVQNLDPLDVSDIDTGNPVIPGQPAPIFQHQYIIVIQAVQTHGCPHTARHKSKRSIHLSQYFFHGREVGFPDILSRNNRYRHRAVFHPPVCSRSGDYNLTDIDVAVFQLHNDLAFPALYRNRSGSITDMSHPQLMGSFGQIPKDKLSFSIGRTTRKTMVYPDIGTIYRIPGFNTHHFTADSRLRPYLTNDKQQNACQRTPLFH